MLLTGVVGAALVAIAAGLTWWSADYVDPLTGPLTVALAGGSCVPELVPLALVGLAGLGASLATTGVPRRLVGLVLLASGLTVAIRSALSFGSAPAGLAGSLTRPAELVGAAQLHPVGPALALLGGLLLAASGVLVLFGVGARRLGSKYERTASRAAARAGNEGEPRGLEQGDWWKAFDAGADPTASTGDPVGTDPGGTDPAGTDRGGMDRQWDSAATAATEPERDTGQATGTDPQAAGEAVGEAEDRGTPQQAAGDANRAKTEQPGEVAGSDADGMTRTASGGVGSPGTDVRTPSSGGSVTASGPAATPPGTTCGSPKGTVSEQTSEDGYDDPQASRPT